MEKNPEIVARLAAERSDENWRFRSFLKTMPLRAQRRIDALAEELGRAAESAMDCTACGACCRSHEVPVDEEEVERLAGRMSLPVLEFRRQHVRQSELNSEDVVDVPCPLLEGSRCSIYEHRPEACRGYPYVGGEIVPRMVEILERAGVCPIVFEMLEQLKLKLDFRRYC